MSSSRFFLLSAVTSVLSGPATNVIKYQFDKKCLSLGAPQPSRDPSWSLEFNDCGGATTWAEGNSTRHGLWPQISAEVPNEGNACMHLDSAGLCSPGLRIHATQCEDEKTKESPQDRFYWDDSAKQLRSQFCLGMCVDFDGNSTVLNDCSNVRQWSRKGPAAIQPFKPQPLTPAATTGRYHMFWPLPAVKGVPVVGVNQDGYPEYYGTNNAEVCPPGRHYNCDGQCDCLWPNITDIPLWHGGEHNGKTPGTTAHPIKRSEILQRAIVWVAHGFASDGDKGRGIAQGIEGCSKGDSRETCPSYFHGGACCSLPTMAWNVSSHSCLRTGSESIRVDCQTEMRPGDAISLQKQGKDTGHNFPGAKHIVIFRKWIDEKKKHMMVYERKGKVRTTQYAYHSDRMYCMKRKNIIEDIP